MRFDEYLQQHGIAAIPVDRFDGFEVEIEGPHDWEAVESRPGLRIWVWRGAPYAESFCANRGADDAPHSNCAGTFGSLRDAV